MAKSASSQPDWEKFWQDTIVSCQSSKFRKARYLLIAECGARECLKLLKGREKIESIIELGGGGGCLSDLLAKKLGLKNEALVLIDKSSEGKKAWEQFSGFGRFIEDDFFIHDFGKQKFDLVLSRGLIEHWADKRERLRIIKKHAELSKKYILIRVPKRGLFMDFFRYNQLATKLFRMMEKVEGYEKLYTAKELRQEISEAGLEIIGFKEGLASLTALATIKRKK